MILYKEDIARYDVVNDAVNLVIFNKVFTEQVLQVEVKVFLYNVDENEYLTLYYRRGFMVDTTVSVTPTNNVKDSSFNETTSGASVQAIISYTQSTSTLNIKLANDGNYATDVGCNYGISIRVLKDT